FALRGSTIGVLHRSGRPAAIARFVIAVVIDAIDGQARRWIAHIGVEVFEATPSLADGDAAASVIVVAWIVRIQTAVEHICPATESASLRHTVHAALSHLLSQLLPSTSPALGCVTRAQTACGNEMFGAAVTTTKPKNMDCPPSVAHTLRVDREHPPAAEALSGEVDEEACHQRASPLARRIRLSTARELSRAR